MDNQNFTVSRGHHCVCSLFDSLYIISIFVKCLCGCKFVGKRDPINQGTFIPHKKNDDSTVDD